MVKKRYNPRRLVVLAAILLVAWPLGVLIGAAADSGVKPVFLIRVEGAISPGTAGFLSNSIAKAAEGGAQALIVELDTPGGLATSMRTMVKSIMNAGLPIVVYVAPSGAQAASAGVMVTMSADIAAMAPGTNIGAAHPVASGGQDIPGDMAEKVVNDMVAFAQSIAKERNRNVDWVKKAIERSVSITSAEAVQLGVVDMTADSRSDLLKKIDGREIKRAGVSVRLRTDGAPIVEVKENVRDRILRTLADPNIAYILMMLGLAGLYFEFTSPGAVVPGIVGGICLILAFYSFQTLPVNYAGILLIVLGIILFLLEIKIASYGALSFGGLVSLTLGSLMLFKTPEEYLRVSLSVLIPVLATVGGFFVIVASVVVKSHVKTTSTGESGLIGQIGPVKEWSGDRGRVLVNGEWWFAVSHDPLQEGDRIEVTEVKGMVLRVRKRISSP